MKYLVKGDQIIVKIIIIKILEAEEKIILNVVKVEKMVEVGFECQLRGEFGHLVNKCWYCFDKDFQPLPSNNSS